MQMRQVSEDVAVAGQINAEDVETVRALGFRSIVCHRPDDEGPMQPPFSEIEAAANAAGLEIVYQPVVSGHLTHEDAVAFAAILKRLPRPLLAYCRSGARSGALFEQALRLRG